MLEAARQHHGITAGLAPPEGMEGREAKLSFISR